MHICETLNVIVPLKEHSLCLHYREHCHLLYVPEYSTPPSRFKEDLCTVVAVSSSSTTCECRRDVIQIAVYTKHGEQQVKKNRRLYAILFIFGRVR